ncbi:hypothetical protein PAXRUDRAFT_830959 [Paxillus rubicundulus Ve08.2h10]|uniref:Mediator of RNA polymerase II transcription subunit 12 n=1 Tax=Paxillus rubicundulus Ve08.2h10 TaxID=930991 RepID=A0A0D0DXU4_9AGAM|nr:hypothetical protein PAXRUDRAFT_830959 [Paxillus rubicundulus Ve08.2h10]
MTKNSTKRDEDPFPIYGSHPPLWIPPSHKSADVGYPGFHPPHPGQDEDVLSESNVKTGFILGTYVQSELSGVTEALSQIDPKRSRVFDHAALTQLETVMGEIFTRRAENIPAIPPWFFKIPSRVTLNDAKRQAWFADLANNDVPLHKLGKSVPHGAKGHDLLDLLQSNNVAIPRALWFLRVFGANETVGLRNKPNYNPTQYSIDWTNVVTSYLKKQLADIALPSAPRLGLNIKQSFKGVLSDSETRERWVSRFTYCLQLLRPFYADGLVDTHTFLVWLVQQMVTCNLAQAGFVAHLADEYLDGMLASRALSKPFVDACLAKLTEIRTSAQGQLIKLDGLLVTLLQRVCLSLPDAFVSPNTWVTHRSLLVSILSDDIGDNSAPGDQRHCEIHRILLDNLSNIQRRNDAMLFRNLPPRVLERLGSMVVDIQTLNSISRTTDMSIINFFQCHSTDCSSPIFVAKLDILLTWAVTPLQFGSHRPFATCTLLLQHREHTARRELSCAALQDYLFDWLDTSEVAADSANIRSVAALFGKLVKDGLFDYATYLQRLVARSEPGLSCSEPAKFASKHREFLRWIPLHNTTSPLSHQRKLILHGARARETPEDVCEREMRREIRAVLPLVFGGASIPPFTCLSALHDSCRTTLNAPRFEQVKIYKQWLLPNFQKFANVSDKFDEADVLQTYSTVVELLCVTRCYGSLLELSLSVLSQTSHAQVVTAVGEVFHRFATVWTSMNATSTIANALYAAHVVWRNRGMQVRFLLALLVEMDAGRHLDEAARTLVAADISSFAHALAPDTTNADMVPQVLPEILLLAEDPKRDAPSILANSLWYKYRTAPDWGWKVWDNTVASLRQVPLMTVDVAKRHTIALRYAQFLLHVDQHLPAGIDEQVLRWFLGTGKGEILALTGDAWDVCSVILLFLCAHGALPSTTILRGLVYPAWTLCASVTSAQQAQSLAIYVQSANALFDCLILRTECQTSSTLPNTLPEIHGFYTRRQDAFSEPHFTFLAAEIPTLVLLEHNEFIPSGLREMAKGLRVKACESRQFRLAAYRDLDVIRRAFEQPIQSGTIGETLFEPLVSALKVILSGSSEGTDVNAFLSSGISSVLSPWRLAATAVQLQFGLRQLGRAMAHNLTKQAASASLDKMTSMLFHHSMASDEAYFIAGVAKEIDGPVAEKFVNNGFKRLVEILTRPPAPFSPDTLAERVDRAGEILRLLSHVTEPLRTKGSIFQLDPISQERLGKAICETLCAVQPMFAAGGASVPSRLTQSVIFLARLLQFNLGFSGPWTTTFREQYETVSLVLFRLALTHASGSYLDEVAFPLLIDTLYFVIDELHSHSKSTVPDLLKYYPTMSEHEFPPDIPLEFHHQLCTLLSHLPPHNVVKNLVHAYRDPSGELTYGSPVQNRPWEWIENLGEPAVEEDANRPRQTPIKNSGSLSLELFAARPTGDHIIPHIPSSSSKDNDNANMRLEGDMRSFEDGLSAENVYRRDWRETRLEAHHDVQAGGSDGEGKDEGADEVGILPVFLGHNRPGSGAGSRRASPASSVRSRGSAHGSNSSMRQSPGLGATNKMSASTISDAMEGSTAGRPAGTKSRKRKAADADDEVEIAGGPIPGKPGAKKSKATKTRAKKK